MSSPADRGARHRGDLSREDLLALVDLSSSLSAEVNISALLPRVLTEAARLTAATAASVILLDAPKRSLFIAEAIGPNASEILARWGKRGGERIPLEGSKAGHVFRTRESIVEAAIADDPDRYKGVDRVAGRATASMVCVPLVAAGESIGVVQLLNKSAGDFSDRDRSLLELFASVAATAIRNARLFDQLLAYMGYCSADAQAEGPLAVMAMLAEPARDELMTLLFADMRSFTHLCHVIARPDRVQSMLNEFLTLLTTCIHAEDGILNRFLGDGVMAMFRGDHGPERAVRCADAMARGFAALKEHWDTETSSSLEFVDIGVGIATDTVILGTLGTEHVPHYTAIGVGVNLAAHLCENARDGSRICIDRRTFMAAKHLVAEFSGPAKLAMRPATSGAAPQEYPYYVVRRLGSAGAALAAAQPSAPRDGGVFISYSYEDGAWLTLLKKHLKPFVRQDHLRIWDDTMLKAGQRWHDQIRVALANARAAIFLVTPDFVASDFIIDEELKALLEKARASGLPLFWMHISASAWEETQLKHFEALLPPKYPLDGMSEPERNAALVKACQKLRDALAEQP